ncbi:MAG: hypothetical protein ACI8RW_002027 [Porticoccaceae bacterium]|jgi:hypothetical protein
MTFLFKRGVIIFLYTGVMGLVINREEQQ